MSRIKWIMMSAGALLCLLLGLLMISYLEYKTAAQYRQKISVLGYELIETRDLITFNSINEVTASYELARHLVAIEQRVGELDRSFQLHDSKFLPFSKITAFALISDFSNTVLSVTDALDHITGLLVARESTLQGIRQIGGRQSGEVETSLFAPFIDSISSANIEQTNPELLRLVGVYQGLNDQLQELLGSVLSGKNASFVEGTEFAFTDLVQSIEHRMVAILLVISLLVLATLSMVYFDRIRELQRNNLAYKQSVEKAKHASEAKSLFLATMSHELRTPMNGVLGIAQLIKEQSNEADIQSQAQIMIESGQHLVTLLNDILDFSKVEQGKMTLEMQPFTFDSITRHIEGTLAPLAENKGVQLEIDNETPSDLRYIGDSSRIRQILFNIVGNAIKFTEQGKVNLTLSACEDRPYNLVIVVKDTGIGISQDKLATIFSPFEQAELSTTRNYGGTGLGLSIVKKLIELMNGDISVFSQPNVGSEFTIKLHLASEELAPKQQQSEVLKKTALEPNQIHVLLAEDNKVNALVMKQFFRAEGYQMTHVTNGRDAVNQLQSDGFDLVIMDNHMPKMSGIEAIKFIRRDLKLDVCIFAFTADVFKEAHDAFIAAGADYVLTKPLQINSLREAIDRFIHAANAPLTVTESLTTAENVVYLTRSPIETLPMTEEELSQSALLVESGLSPEETADLLATFIEEVELKIEDLINAYSQSSCEPLYKTLHSVKGILFELGLSEASNLAQQTEASARDGVIPDLILLQSLINRLQVNVHQANRLIAEQQQQNTTMGQNG
ncbi:ATP-binding protein [Vibrio hippocampi]|uniref:histidine kinase n=1 Tax=Vibrio hippocampi TaxID=654686 RepID=A0ABM8ZHF4_9VIBR|nr:ATP-binding protein [Vibrio hippocampi]CAH0526078.1 Sensor histidine kinase RcsC [Vibrio hippocampi]